MKRSAWNSLAGGVILPFLALIIGCDKGDVPQGEGIAETKRPARSRIYFKTLRIHYNHTGIKPDIYTPDEIDTIKYFYEKNNSGNWSMETVELLLRDGTKKSYSQAMKGMAVDLNLDQAVDIPVFFEQHFQAADPENRITNKDSRQSAEPESKKRASSNIVAEAREQIGTTVIYDGSYQRLKYPGGDVPLERGVCTDVVIRALRASLGMDLQVLVHEDMNAAFHEYPKIWRLKKTDRNIDHRRVPNLAVYFKRKGYGFTVSQRKKDYLPGDLVTCTVPPNRPHIMIVSDSKSRDDTCFIIHNIGYGTVEENRLFEFPITGHYRIKSLGSVKVQ